jgi:hypothetical protein
MIRQKINEFNLEDSLLILSRWLYEHHGYKTYVLIDEYDFPLLQAQQ